MTTNNVDTPLAEMVCYNVEDPSVLDGRLLPLYSYSQYPPIQMILTGIWKDGWYADGMEHISKIEHPLILDVGAHIGVSCIYFAQHPGAKIIAVEPSPDSFHCLALNIQGWDVTAYQVALYNGRGARQIEFPRYSSLGDSLFMVPNDERKDDRVPALAMDIVTFMDAAKIEHIDLLKINAEGSEYMLFLSEAFREAVPRIDMIVGEAHYNMMPPVIAQWALEQAGYSFRWLDIRNHHYHWRGTLGAEDFDILPDVPTLFVAERKYG